jgi:type II secretory pathway component GspD/PulD (secretin)
MERTDLLDIGVEWGFPQISAGAFGTSLDTGDGKWPWGVQIGYSSDQTFTNALLMALNLLEKNGQADIVSNPQVLAQDGKVAQLGVITEEYYMLTPPETATVGFYSTTEMVTIESGTKLRITPRIGDNDDITLVVATEVSDSVPAAAATELPVVTRRTATNVVTVRDGGTVALAGLTENRSSKEDRRVPGFSNLPLIGELFKNTNNEGRTREIAVFVTAYLVSETGQPTYEAASQPPTPQGFAAPQPQAPATSDFQAGLMRSLQTNPQR